ncbi:MAG: succinate dehydrogenase cytochrome b subunit [Bacteroidales bacterium]|nr:succinate dehydrogenase cytochrome b subunit [Bacteroidales bacterium]
MSSIFKSSIGRKLIMSITGMFLVLFLLFHMSMNLVAVFSASAYNAVCGFLGTNWYALAGTAVLALGFFCHIVYAFILTLQNRKARGNDRYAVVDKPAAVEWASQNMLVLGIIVALGLVLHLSQFWHKMMFAELTGTEHTFLATDGGAWLKFYFGQWWVAAVYVVWLVALWFHLTHGFWSMFQSIGWNNQIWLDRWKCVANWFSTIVCAGFAIVVLGYATGVAPVCDTVECATQKLEMEHHHHGFMSPMPGAPACGQKPECGKHEGCEAQKQGCDKKPCCAGDSTKCEKPCQGGEAQN